MEDAAKPASFASLFEAATDRLIASIGADQGADDPPYAGKQIPAELVRKVHELAARSASYQELRSLPAYPCASRQRLDAKARRRTTPTERAVLAVLRRAWRGGKPAAQLSVAHLAALADGFTPRSIQNALDGLGSCAAYARRRARQNLEPRPCEADCRRHLDMVDRIAVFDSVSWRCKRTGKLFRRRQRANVLMFTRRAPLPGRPRRPHAAATPAPRSRAQENGAETRRSRSASGRSPGKIFTPTAPPVRRRGEIGSASSRPHFLARATAAPNEQTAPRGGVAFGDRGSGGLTAASQGGTRELGGAGRPAGDAPANPERESPAAASSGRGREGSASVRAYAAALAAARMPELVVAEQERGGRPSLEEFERWKRERMGLPPEGAAPAPDRRELLAELERKSREVDAVKGPAPAPADSLSSDVQQSAARSNGGDHG